jgi:type VI protein secretion system component Hcp
MLIPRRLALVVAFACVAGFAEDALAQRAFLQIPAIPGESVVEGYVGWIDVLSVRQNTAAAARKSIACDVSVVKGIDSAGPALWATAAGGLAVPEMLIVVVREGGDALVKLYDVRLTNVRITGVQATAGAADSSETVTLLPQGVTITYDPQLPTGSQGTPVSQTFSCQ